MLKSDFDLELPFSLCVDLMLGRIVEFSPRTIGSSRVREIKMIVAPLNGELIDYI